jgi:hypothetical protein
MSDRIVAEAATYTTQNKHNRRTFMRSAGLELAILANKRLQTYSYGWPLASVESFSVGIYSTT